MEEGKGLRCVEWGHWFAISSRPDREGLSKKMAVKVIKDRDIEISGEIGGRVRKQRCKNL